MARRVNLLRSAVHGNYKTHLDFFFSYGARRSDTELSIVFPLHLPPSLEYLFGITIFRTGHYRTPATHCKKSYCSAPRLGRKQRRFFSKMKSGRDQHNNVEVGTSTTATVRRRRRRERRRGLQRTSAREKCESRFLTMRMITKKRCSGSSAQSVLATKNQESVSLDARLTWLYFVLIVEYWRYRICFFPV